MRTCKKLIDRNRNELLSQVCWNQNASFADFVTRSREEMVQLTGCPSMEQRYVARGCVHPEKLKRSSRLDGARH
jgi:hypothetical protein